jgi:hypothetical protein
MSQPAPNPAQVTALRTYAASHGRTWKSQLNQAWLTGSYDAGDPAPLLQQIRNNHGPAWLSRFSLRKAGQP